jgi:glycosyltransferase involved in cell wall biosynthesis
MAAYSEQGRSLLAARSPGAHTSVVGTGAPDLHIPPKRSDGRTIGLIARDFELKGADVALDAFALLRARTPAARLLVITRTADTARPELTQPGVEVRTERPRAEVLASWWPRVDILLAPTRADCGAPYSFLEALQSGTPVVASTLPWLDDRLVPPAAFRLPLDPATIAAELDRLLEPAALAEARAAATELWAESFSMDALGAELEALYRRASGAGRTASADEQPSTG